MCVLVIHLPLLMYLFKYFFEEFFKKFKDMYPDYVPDEIPDEGLPGGNFSFKRILTGVKLFLK